MSKPFAESCEQNKEPILSCLREIFTEETLLLEIGSGTGQHAVYFARHLPHLTWQTSDLTDHHHTIQQWLDDADLENALSPLALDVAQANWPISQVGAIFSANALHIMSWHHVSKFFEGAGNILQRGGKLVVYGPFNYNGKFTCNSNARFEQWLKDRDPLSGIRDFEALDTLAKQSDMAIDRDIEMPVNNRILVWVKQ